jgi:hypothetical protein
MIEVVGNRMSFEQFKENLRNGLYYIPTSRINVSMCAKIQYSEDALASAKNIFELKEERLTDFRRIAQESSFSSETKVFIRPSIPFNLAFNGQALRISTMTLFHPSPIRIENIQHDAVLTLGDMDTSDFIILIPLAGVSIPKEQARFIGKIASYIPGVLQQNPASGLYPRIDVPTGNDWNLSTIFPGTPSGGQNIADVGYYVWNAMPPLERYLKRTIRGDFLRPDTHVYGWRPVGVTGKKFLMLSKPIEISAFDLQTIRMLPITPPEKAIPVPYLDSLVYNPSTKCNTTTAASASAEGFENRGRCDPLAQLPAIQSDVSRNLFNNILFDK